MNYSDTTFDRGDYVYYYDRGDIQEGIIQWSGKVFSRVDLTVIPTVKIRPYTEDGKVELFLLYIL